MRATGLNWLAVRYIYLHAKQEDEEAQASL